MGLVPKLITLNVLKRYFVLIHPNQYGSFPRRLHQTICYKNVAKDASFWHYIW